MGRRRGKRGTRGSELGLGGLYDVVLTALALTMGEFFSDFSLYLSESLVVYRGMSGR